MSEVQTFDTTRAGVRRDPISGNGPEVQSFETAQGDAFGDLLSRNRRRSHRPIKIGLLSGAFFEYWRMYPKTLKAKIEQDTRVVLNRLSTKHAIVYPGLVDTVDAADHAGRMFRDEKIDLLIISERSYVPDVYIHQALSHLGEVPILLYVSQSHDTVDLNTNYEETLRESGMMSSVQLVAGFRKMGKYKKLEVVVGSIHDEEAYRKIDEYIDVVSIYHRLKCMTIGNVGHVFRGMFDFEYDKTMLQGTLGPEVLNVQISHLLDLWESLSDQDPEMRKLIKKVHTDYEIAGVEDEDIVAAARVGVAIQRLVERFRLDALVLLGQHYVEAKTKATSYLGMAELHARGEVMGLTEGDVPGLIMMKILRALAGRTPFFGEYAEFDVKRNVMMLLGHGFADPTQSRRGTRPRITPTPEQWGLQGNGFSFEMTFEPGICTMSHVIRDAEGWRMLITDGEILDLPALPIHDCSLLVKIQRPIKEFVELVTKAGFAHHAITVRGDVRTQLGQLADLLGIQKVRI
jgi:L-arabinose isomerase